MISVIVPLYNAYNTIEKCLLSVQQQTYKDFEVIIIDDGSTDSSASLCKSFCKKDRRFIYFYKENEGVSAARNMGIEKSRGESICFLDSDDVVSPDYLKHLSNDSADLIITGAKVYKTNAPYSQYKEAKDIKVSENEINELIKLGGLNVVWGKRFKKDILNKFNIRFNESFSYGEDTLFVTTYLLYCQNISLLSYTDYYYRIDQTDSLSGIISMKTVDAVDQVYNEIYKVLIERYPDYKFTELKSMQNRLNFSRMFQVFENDQLDLKKKKEIFKHIQRKEWYKEMRKHISDFFPKSRKVQVLFIINSATLIILFFHISEMFRGGRYK